MIVGVMDGDVTNMILPLTRLRYSPSHVERHAAIQRTDGKVPEYIRFIISTIVSTHYIVMMNGDNGLSMHTSNHSLLSGMSMVRLILIQALHDLVRPVYNFRSLSLETS